MKKIAIGISIVQFIVIILFLFLLCDTQPVDLPQTKQLNITVKRIDYRRDFNEYNLYIYAGSKEYKFSKGALLAEYGGVYDVSNELNVGDTLTIIYIEDCNVLGKYNLIIDACSIDDTYLSYERFNADKHNARIGISILFGIVELIFITISVFKLILNKKFSFKNM